MISGVVGDLVCCIEIDYICVYVREHYRMVDLVER